MEESILTTIKKLLGIAEEYTAFDLDVITHINSAFFTITQLGIGPSGGFAIEDAEAVWDDFLGEGYQYTSLKTYLFLKVKMVFDPPTTSYLITSIEKQILELEVRLSTSREGTDWVDPTPSVPPGEDIFGDTVVLDGGGP